jgi:hypothetical protein
MWSRRLVSNAAWAMRSPELCGVTWAVLRAGRSDSEFESPAIPADRDRNGDRRSVSKGRNGESRSECEVFAEGGVPFPFRSGGAEWMKGPRRAYAPSDRDLRQMCLINIR